MKIVLEISQILVNHPLSMRKQIHLTKKGFPDVSRRERPFTHGLPVSFGYLAFWQQNLFNVICLIDLYPDVDTVGLA
jgi:hypothetical protein